MKIDDDLKNKIIDYTLKFGVVVFVVWLTVVLFFALQPQDKARENFDIQKALEQQKIQHQKEQQNVYQ